jgi:L-iditol 2-dehydrogenase
VVGECIIGDDHFGFSISGAAADFLMAKSPWLHKLPEQLSWTDGALVEPSSVAYYALLRAGDVDASDTLVVLCAGPVGLTVTAASSAMGAVTASGSRHRSAATPPSELARDTRCIRMTSMPCLKTSRGSRS